jgi:hypothetical protein
MIEKNLEMRGMRRKEIMDYFLEVHNGINYQVDVGEESFVSLGSITIPATVVVFRGEEEYVEEAIEKFRLRFLSAGG